MKHLYLYLSIIPLFVITASAQEPVEHSSGLFTTGIYEFAEGGDSWYARADHDILVSDDRGESWRALPSLPEEVRILEIEADDRYLWTSTDAGLFRWDRKDERWTRVSDRIHHHLYATVNGNLLGAPGSSGDLERSTDGGETWDVVVEGFALRDATAATDGTIWVADGTAVLFSEDEGVTWTLFGGESGSVSAVRLHTSGEGDILALGRENVWLSDRESGRWLLRGELPEHDSIFALFNFPHPSGVLYLGVSTGDEKEPTRYHLSGDTARAWTSGFSSLGHHGYQGSTQHAVLVDYADSTILVGLSYGSLSSRADQFSEFGQIIRSRADEIHGFWDLIFTASIGASRVTSLAVGSGGTLYAGREMPFFLAEESNSWVFRSSDGGGEWDERSIGDAGGVLSVTSDGTLFVTGTPGVLFRSTDQGMSWDSTLFRESDLRPIGEVLEVADDLLVMESVTDKVSIESWVSKDGGSVWEPVGEHEWFGGHAGKIVDRDGRIYSAAGKIVHVSVDSGRTWFWRSVAGELLDHISDIVLLQDDRPLVSTTAGQLYTTDDRGESWEPVINNLSDTLLSMVVDDKGNIYGGASTGTIWRSTDDGRTWRAWAYIPDSPSPIISLVHGADDHIYIGTLERGVWRADIDRIGDVGRGERGVERLNLR